MFSTLRVYLTPAYDDGRTVLLLLCDGTVPVPFRGYIYNYPMNIWFPRAYPAEAPFIFVVPTPAMVVRRGPHVSQDGRVSIDYMKQWEKKPEVRATILTPKGCNIIELLRECQTVFSVEPPVMAKPHATPPKPHPDPSYPASLSSSLATEAAPRPPPKADSTPLPERPPKPTVSHLSSPMDKPRLSTEAVPQPSRPMNPALALVHAKAYQVVRNKVESLQTSLAESNKQLHMLLDDLQRGYPAMEDEMMRLRAVRELCHADATTWADTFQAAQLHTAESHSRADPDIDHALSSTNIVENQYVDVHDSLYRLLQLMAEDQAIEDTMYHLGRALYLDHLPLDRFIKVGPCPSYAAHSHAFT